MIWGSAMRFTIQALTKQVHVRMVLFYFAGRMAKISDGPRNCKRDGKSECFQ